MEVDALTLAIMKKIASKYGGSESENGSISYEDLKKHIQTYLTEGTLDTLSTDSKIIVEAINEINLELDNKLDKYRDKKYAGQVLTVGDDGSIDYSWEVGINQLAISKRLRNPHIENKNHVLIVNDSENNTFNVSDYGHIFFSTANLDNFGGSVIIDFLNENDEVISNYILHSYCLEEFNPDQKPDAVKFRITGENNVYPVCVLYSNYIDDGYALESYVDELQALIPISSVIDPSDDDKHVTLTIDKNMHPGSYLYYNDKTYVQINTIVYGHRMGYSFLKGYGVISVDIYDLSNGRRSITIKFGDYGYTYMIDDNDEIYSKSEMRNVHVGSVLTKTNTEEYTPTADFHPATKKYVDESIPMKPISDIATISSSVPTTITISIDDTWEVGSYDYYNDKQFITVKLKIYGTLKHVFLFDTSNYLTISIIDTGDIRDICVTCGFSNCRFYKLNGNREIIGETNNSAVYKRRVLEIDNATEYTPTQDYNPATKKYVDDAIYIDETELDNMLQEVLGE